MPRAEVFNSPARDLPKHEAVPTLGPNMVFHVLTFVRFRGCRPWFSAALTPPPHPSPHTPRGTLTNVYAMENHVYATIALIQPPAVWVLFWYAWARPRRAVGIASDSRARNPGSVPGPATINHCVKFAVQQYGSTTVWQYSSVAIQQDRSPTVWQFNNMAVQQYGSTAAWQYSSVAVQQYGSAAVHNDNNKKNPKQMNYFRIRTLKTFVLSVSKYKCVD